MSIWDNKPYLYQIFLGLMLLAAGFLSFANFYRIFSSPTDENYYTGIENSFYTVNNIAAKNLKGSEIIIRKGDLIVSFEDQKIKGFAKLDSLAQRVRKSFVKVTAANAKQTKPLIAFVDKDKLNRNNLKFLDNALLIFEIQKGGASDRAGLKPGDIIIRINGKIFNDVIEADKYLRSSKVIHYDILRDNNVKTYEVTVAKFGLSFSFLGIFLTAIAFMFTGGLFGLKRPNLKAARIVSLALVVIGIMLGSGFELNTLRYDNFVMIKRFVFFMAYFTGIPLLIHSFLYFPNQHNELLKRKHIFIVPYIIGIIAFTMVILDYYLLRKDYLTRLALNLYIPLVVIYAVSLRIIYKRFITPKQKRIARALRISFYIAYAIFLIEILLSLVPALREFFIGINILQAAQNLYIGLILTPVSYIYTAGRYHLLNMNIRVRRNIQYNLLSFFLKFMILVISLVFVLALTEVEFPLPNLHFTGSTIEVLTNPLRPVLQDKWENMIFIFLGLLLAYILYKTLNKFQKKLDKVFFRVKFDYRSSTQKIREMIESKVNPQEIAKSLSEYLADIVSVRRVGTFMFRNQSAIAAQEYSGFHNEDFMDYCYAIDRKLAELIKRYSGPIHLDYLPEDIRKVFQEFRFIYIIPIKLKHTLLGAILIGEKLSESAFNNEDFEFMMSIASHAAVAMENAFLYENLAKQERIKHELEIARQIQLASLPQSVPDIHGLDIAGASFPALEVGGDFYDYLNSESNQVTVIVGDVSGKGASSAIYMSNAQGIMRTLHEFNLAPKELFIRANRLLYKYLEKKFFITAVAAKVLVNEKKIKLARAGHLPLYIYRKSSGEIEKITPKGLALGISKGQDFARNLEEIDISYSQGDIFIFVTDGITEARNSMNQDYGEDNLFNVIKRNALLNSEEIKNSIIESVKRFIEYEEPFDDMSLVIVKAI